MVSPAHEKSRPRHSSRVHRVTTRGSVHLSSLPEQCLDLSPSRAAHAHRRCFPAPHRVIPSLCAISASEIGGRPRVVPRKPCSLLHLSGGSAFPRHSQGELGRLLSPRTIQGGNPPVRAARPSADDLPRARAQMLCPIVCTVGTLPSTRIACSNSRSRPLRSSCPLKPNTVSVVPAVTVVTPLRGCRIPADRASHDRPGRPSVAFHTHAENYAGPKSRTSEPPMRTSREYGVDPRGCTAAALQRCGVAASKVVDLPREIRRDADYA